MELAGFQVAQGPSYNVVAKEDDTHVTIRPTFCQENVKKRR